MDVAYLCNHSKPIIQRKSLDDKGTTVNTQTCRDSRKNHKSVSDRSNLRRPALDRHCVRNCGMREKGLNQKLGTKTREQSGTYLFRENIRCRLYIRKHESGSPFRHEHRKCVQTWVASSVGSRTRCTNGE